MNTKRVTIVGIQEDELVREAAVLRQKRIDGAIDSLNEDLQAVLQYMYLKVSEQSWIPMEGGVFFEPSVMSVFPDPAVYPIGHCSISRPYEPASFQGRFGPYEGQLMTPQELKLAFGKNPAFCQEYLGVPAEEVCFTCGDPPLPYSLLTGESKRWKSFSKGESYHVPISRLCTNNSSVYTNMQILFLWLTYRLIPRELSPQLSKAFQRLCELMKCNREYYTYGRKISAFAGERPGACPGTERSAPRAGSSSPHTFGGGPEGFDCPAAGL